MRIGLVEKFSRFISKKVKSLIKALFSLRNSKDKTHKIITILGIKIKIKRKKA